MATKKLTKDELISKVGEFKAGSGTTIVFISTPQMRKTSREDDEVKNPYYDRVTKVTKFTGVQIGTNFTKAKMESAKRSGVEFNPNKFMVPRKGSMIYINQFILKDGDSNELYLPVQWTEKNRMKGIVKIESTYLLDECPMTQWEFKDMVDNYLYPSRDYVPADQEDFKPEEVRKYLTLKFDNILTIKQGEKLLRLK